MIPCKDCITLPVCKTLVLDKYHNDEFAMAGCLCSKCVIFNKYLQSILAKEGTYEIFVMQVLSFFRGLEHETSDCNKHPM